MYMFFSPIQDIRMEYLLLNKISVPERASGWSQDMMYHALEAWKHTKAFWAGEMIATEVGLQLDSENCTGYYHFISGLVWTKISVMFKK